MSGNVDRQGLLSPKEAARILGLSKPHIYLLARNGQIPSIKFSRAVRFDRDDLEAYVEAHRRSKPADGNAA